MKIIKETLEVKEVFAGFQGDFPFSLLEEPGTEPGEDALGALWESVHEKKTDIAEIDQEGDEIGVTFASAKPGHFTYFAGAKKKENSAVSGMDEYILPAGDYIVCSFEAKNFEALVTDALYKAQKYLYEDWLKERGIQTEAFCVERYARHDADATQMELWLRIAGQ